MVDPHSHEFLDYYASVLEREAAARPGQNVDWMIEGAARAREQAAVARVPAQADLFWSEA
ncbi:hypothetical protein IB024_01700 [Brucella sp. 6810]|uniref:hypothetical protein n=1 Tax=Brucella sp. 6810 TaxID=2769351 RepID=UPI00165B5DD4|nr:hypothetical protein [Brucella sp. 6810]QNQ62497.1 hypothetical protein IB024_01700 [Brucella sp. 6810]